MKTPQFPDKLHRAHETKTGNLNRRGRKTRTAVTAAEVAFCAYYVLTGNAKQASLQAGYSAWWGYELLKMPRVQPTLREFERRKHDEAWDTAKDRIVLTREFLDELFIQRIVSMRTHPKVGDLPIVKMFETGYKRTGDIQPVRISAEAKTGVFSQLYAKRLYLPEWRKEAIERIQRAEREESGTELTCEGNARKRQTNHGNPNHTKANRASRESSEEPCQSEPHDIQISHLVGENGAIEKDRPPSLRGRSVGGSGDPGWRHRIWTEA